MSPDLLAFLFLVTSTAIVLGVVVILRGLYGLVSGPSPRPPERPLGDASGDDAGSSTSPNTGAGTPVTPNAAAQAPIVRDLREPLVMTIGGVFIVSGALVALATLIHSAP